MKRGFSLIEILVVIALIGLIVAGIGGYVMSSLSKGQLKTARTTAYEIAKTVDMFRLDYGRYPTQAEGLEILVHPPKGEPLLDQMPKDPWGNDYVYQIPGEVNKRKFDVYSKGPNGSDDITQRLGNWQPEGE